MLSAALLASCDGERSSQAPDRTTTAPLVTEVIDGDTISVVVDGDTERLRLIGINAPERGECLAEEATGWLRERTQGQAVALVSDVSQRDRYGRLLRYVEVDGADIGAELVRAGLAIARRYPPDTARHAEYERTQRMAEQVGAGMWAADVCGGGPTDADVVIAEVRFDAAGDDNLNLTDEWVRIANQGSSPVDLTGWILKDESASHRYSFPPGFALGAGTEVTVRTGCGTDSDTDLHWCMEGSAVWNNGGDTAFLLDPHGNVVDSLRG